MKKRKASPVRRVAWVIAAAILIFTAPTAPLLAQPITEIVGAADATNSLVLAGTPPQPRIVNGVDTFDYPPVGALLYTNYEGTGFKGRCTATLVGCQTVLTAAHCVCFYPETPDDPEPVTLMGPFCITLGVAEAFRPRLVFSLPDAGEFHVAAVSVHPNPRLAGLGGDLALLHLDRPVTGIAPAAINSTAKPAFGTAGTIVGFGASSAVGGRKNAEGYGLKRTGRIVTDECGVLTGAQNDTQVCWLFDEPLGPPGEDSDTCYGDSGGPLFVNAGEGPVLAGVTSGGSNDDCAPTDEVYDADVFAHLSWIEDTAGADLGSGPCGAGPQIGEDGTQREIWTGTLEPGHNAENYSVEVPGGTGQMRIALNHQEQTTDSATCPPEEPRCPNEFALYVKFGAPPSPEDFDCADTVTGPFHYCEINHPQAGTWHMQALRSVGAGPYQLTANTLPSGPAPCAGDCNEDSEVTVSELITLVNIALDAAQVSECAVGDANGNGQITIDELVAAVGSALDGCGV